MKPKLVVFRGKPTSGKSTAWHSLRKKKELKDWAFIDNASIKNMFDNFSDKDRKAFGNKVLFSALKAVMPTKKNILINRALVCLVLVNCVPLFGVMLLGWKASEIILLYWIENLIIGFINTYWLRAVTPTSKKPWDNVSMTMPLTTCQRPASM